MTKVNAMKTPYKILKLRSGEELIAKICGESKGKLILERPMIFKTVLLSSNYGTQKEITILKNWLSLSNDIETKIPKDFVATFLDPDNSVLELYDLEKRKEDVDPPSPKKIIQGGDIDNKPKKPKSISDILDKMTDENVQEMFESIQDDLKEMRESDEGFDDFPDMGESKNLINMSMFLPPEALLSLVDAGLLDIKDIQQLIDTMNNEYNKNISDNYTGDETDRDDFGTKWTDWSPDPKDYL
jgi:hypothetical protein